MTDKFFLVRNSKIPSNRDKLPEAVRNFLNSNQAHIDTHNEIEMNEDLFRLFVSALGYHVRYFYPSYIRKDLFRVDLVKSAIPCNDVLSMYLSEDNIPSFPVEVKGNGASSVALFANIVSNTLSEVIKGKIILHSSRGVQKEMSPRGAFQIYCWSHPNINFARVDVSVPSELWGFITPDRYGGYKPEEGTSDELVIKYNGYAVAEVCANALYIYHNALGRHSADGEKIFARIMIEAAKIIDKDIDWKSIEDGREERIQSAYRQAYQNILERAIPRRISRNKDKAKSLNDRVKSLEFDLHKSRKELANFSASLDRESAIQSFSNDFQKLQNNHPKVERVQIHGDRVVIYTNEIISHDKRRNKHYNLGKIRLDFGLGNSYSISASSASTENRLPHTDGGSLCLGNIGDQVNAYIANYELTVAVDLMVAFFEKGVDSGDEWGKYIKYFPEVEINKSKDAA